MEEDFSGPAPFEGFDQNHPNSFHSQMSPAFTFDASLSDNRFHFLSNGPLPLISTGGNVTLVEVIKKLDTIVHPLREISPEGRLAYIQNAFLIRENIIITSRHGVDGKILGTLRFQLPGEVPNSLHKLSLIEDGAEFNEDYVLFKIVPEGEQPSLYPALPVCLDSPLNSESILSLSCYETPLQLRKGVMMGMAQIPPHAYAFNVMVRLFSEQGYCGAPYVTASGIVGFHLKAAKQIMFDGEKEGFFFGDVHPHSILYALTRNLPLGHSISLINDPYFEFDDLSIPDLFYKPEAKGKREFIFGATPSITSKTGQNVLQRWEQNKSAEYKKERNPNMYKDKSNWTLQLFKNEAGKKVETQLDTTKSYISNKSGETKKLTLIHMGHKLSCSEYWNKGSAPYLNKRIGEITVSTKSKYNTTAKKEAKIKELKQRYLPYQEPFKEVFAGFFTKQDKASSAKFKKARRTFMTDGQNYRFEWGPDNSSAGTALADYEPSLGFEWTGPEKKPVLTKK